MEVKFRNRKLEKCYREEKQANKAYGREVGRRYIQRIKMIQAAANLDELMKLPSLRCHPLKGDRQGYYAINLTGFYRLIFTLEGEQLNITMIEEVSKHYDD